MSEKSLKNKPFQASILYVDDELDNLQIFKVMYRRYFDVLVASNTEEATNLLTEHEIALIITDQLMPRETGTQFLKRIKPSYPDTPKIILSGYSDFKTLVEGINECGVFKFISKPYESSALKTIIEEAVEVYHTMKRLRDLDRNASV